MGNDIEPDLGKYSCSCVQKEDGCFMDFFSEKSSKDPFNFITNSSKYSKYLTRAELQENVPGGLHYPNDNMVKSNLKKNFDIKNKNSKITESFENTNRNMNTKENDIKEFDKRTDYFQLVNKINDTIKELKAKIYMDDSRLSSKTKEGELDFKKLGKKANKIIFSDIISCIKKISDIDSEVVLQREKIYLGIVNKFKKGKKDENILNYEDKEKIVELPNFDEIDEKYKMKLDDKYKNNKFKFYKFNIKGSFPSEILIWNLISQNTQKIADILSENYFCSVVLLYYSKDEEENETILYLINKPTNI